MLSFTHTEHTDTLSESKDVRAVPANGLVATTTQDPKEFLELELRKIVYQEVMVNFHAESVTAGKDKLEYGESTLVGKTEYNVGKLCKVNQLPYLLELISLNNPLHQGAHLLSIFYNLSKLPKGSRVRFLIGDEIQKWNLALKKLCPLKTSPSNSAGSSPHTDTIRITALEQQDKISPREKAKKEFIELAQSLRDQAIHDGEVLVTSPLFQYGLQLLRQSGVEYHIDYLHKWLETAPHKESNYIKLIDKLLTEDSEFERNFGATQQDFGDKVKRRDSLRFDKILTDCCSKYFKREELSGLMKLFDDSSKQIRENNKLTLGSGSGLPATTIEKDLKFTHFTYTFSSQPSEHPDGYLFNRLWHCFDTHVPYLRTLHNAEKFTIASTIYPTTSVMVPAANNSKPAKKKVGLATHASRMGSFPAPIDVRINSHDPAPIIEAKMQYLAIEGEMAKGRLIQLEKSMSTYDHQPKKLVPSYGSDDDN